MTRMPAVSHRRMKDTENDETRAGKKTKEKKTLNEMIPTRDGLIKKKKNAIIRTRRIVGIGHGEERGNLK